MANINLQLFPLPFSTSALLPMPTSSAVSAKFLWFYSTFAETWCKLVESLQR